MAGIISQKIILSLLLAVLVVMPALIQAQGL